MADEMWIDLPADRHRQGGNVAFMDGHVEHWRWVGAKEFVTWGTPARQTKLQISAAFRLTSTTDWGLVVVQ